MTLTQKLTFIFFIFCAGLMHSQTELPKNELDVKYTPNASSMFNNLIKKSGDENYFVDIEFKNAVTYCPTLLARQKVGFFYERAVYKGLVLTCGIGKAFGRDIFQNAVFTSRISQFSDASVLSPQDALTYCSYLSSRPFISVGTKIYFTGTSFEELYLEINYRRERINYLLNPLINDNRVDGENDLIFKMNAFSLGFGYTAVSGSKNNIINQFYINLGTKTFNFTRYDDVSVPNPIITKNDHVYRKGDGFVPTRILFTLNIGYCIGFGW